MPFGFLLANQSCVFSIIKYANESPGWYSFPPVSLCGHFFTSSCFDCIWCAHSRATTMLLEQQMSLQPKKTFCDSGLIHLRFCHGASSGASVGSAFRWPSWCSKWCNRNTGGAVAINTTNDPSRFRSLTFSFCGIRVAVTCRSLHGLHVWLVLPYASGILKTTCFDC